MLGSALSSVAATTKAALSDIIPSEKRKTFVDLVSGLAKQAKPAPLPADLAFPFGPPGFEQTDAEERASSAAAAGRSGQAAKVVSDRDTLARIAPVITPSGTFMLPGGEPVLVFGSKKVKTGTHFTVTVSGQDYDLELVRIDRTTYTLRLNREEITRPITKGKSP
jgi:hypothetical protein